MNKRWPYTIPFTLITLGEFLYAMYYFVNDDKHGWNGLQGLGIVIWLFIPTILANLTVLVITMNKLTIRAIIQTAISIVIFVIYWSSINMH